MKLLAFVDLHGSEKAYRVLKKKVKIEQAEKD